MPEPHSSSSGAAPDELSADRPLLAVVPVPEPPSGGGAAGPSPAGAGQQQPPPQQQHNLLLYSLRSHGYVRSLAFSSEVLGVQASSRLLVVALRGQLQAFDARTLQHTFSCLSYTPPAPSLLLPGSSARDSAARQQQQFVTAGLTSSGSSDGLAPNQQQQGQGAGGSTASAAAPAAAAAAAAAAALAPFALGPRWLAYASDSPVPQAGGQAMAQRLPLARRDSSSSSSGAAASASFSGTSQLDDAATGAAARGPGNGLTKAAVADAALQVSHPRKLPLLASTDFSTQHQCAPPSLLIASPGGNHRCS